MAFYRVVAGKHYEGMGQDRKVYETGDIVESDMDLLSMNQPGAIKFELVDSGGRPVNPPKPRKPPAPPQPSTPQPQRMEDDGLDALNVTELKALAQDEEIDLGTATKKQDIIATIRNAMAGA